MSSVQIKDFAHLLNATASTKPLIFSIGNKRIPASSVSLPQVLFLNMKILQFLNINIPPKGKRKQALQKPLFKLQPPKTKESRERGKEEELENEIEGGKIYPSLDGNGYVVAEVGPLFGFLFFSKPNIGKHLGHLRFLQNSGEEISQPLLSRFLPIRSA